MSARGSIRDLNETELVYAESIGKKVLQARKELGLSQSSLAEMANCTRLTISLIEKGKRLPNVKTLMILSSVLGKQLNIKLN